MDLDQINPKEEFEDSELLLGYETLEEKKKKEKEFLENNLNEIIQEN